MAHKASNGMYLTGALFKERAELTTHIENHVRFSLHEDIPGLVNARREFVALEDPTGYEFAMKHLDGSYEQWNRLMQCSWFQDALRLWMLELNAKFKAKAFKRIKEMADDTDVPHAVRLQANKYLHSLDKTTHSRGRPSQEEVTGEMKRLAEEARSVKEDMERIGLKVIQ